MMMNDGKRRLSPPRSNGMGNELALKKQRVDAHSLAVKQNVARDVRHHHECICILMHVLDTSSRVQEEGATILRH